MFSNIGRRGEGLVRDGGQLLQSLKTIIGTPSLFTGV